MATRVDEVRAREFRAYLEQQFAALEETRRSLSAQRRERAQRRSTLETQEQERLRLERLLSAELRQAQARAEREAFRVGLLRDYYL